jgi:hypothetical protein
MLIFCIKNSSYKGVSRSFKTCCLEQELQMVKLSATRCSCITILWVSVVHFATITFCVASQQVFVIVYFINKVRKLLDTPLYKWNPTYEFNTLPNHISPECLIKVCWLTWFCYGIREIMWLVSIMIWISALYLVIYPRPAGPNRSALHLKSPDLKLM